MNCDDDIPISLQDGFIKNKLTFLLRIHENNMPQIKLKSCVTSYFKIQFEILNNYAWYNLKRKKFTIYSKIFLKKNGTRYPIYRTSTTTRIDSHSLYRGYIECGWTHINE